MHNRSDAAKQNLLYWLEHPTSDRGIHLRRRWGNEFYSYVELARLVKKEARQIVRSSEQVVVIEAIDVLSVVRGFFGALMADRSSAVVAGRH